MTEQVYLDSVASHLDDDQDVNISLPDGSGPCASPVTSAYSHISYIATGIAQSTYPASSEALLLTPISLAGSPPLQHAAKLMQNYNTPPTASTSQQPTPPATSLMYWPPSAFDLRASQGGPDSPMDPNHSSTSATPSHFDMAYIAADVAARDEIPEPPGSPYFGHFGVSESGRPSQDDRLAASYYGIHDIDPSPLIMNHHQHPHADDRIQQHPGMAASPPLPRDAGAQPILSSQDLNSVFHHQPASGLGPEQQQQQQQQQQQPTGTTSSGHRGGRQSRSASDGGPAAESRDRGFRVSKKTNKSRAAKAPARSNRNRGSTPQNSGSGSSRSDEEPIRFKESVPDEERYLIELRMRYHGVKGKTMWDDIGNEFAKKFGRKPEKAALQMKLSRAKHKWIEWSDRDRELLRDIFYEDEKDRYRRMMARFHDRGGGRNIGFNVGNIECQLVEMGLEELYMDPDTHIRARVKGGDHRRPGDSSKVEAVNQQPAQLGVHSMLFYDGMRGFSLTEEQREVLYKQVERREEDARAGGGSPMDGVVAKDDGPTSHIKEEAQHDMNALHQLPGGYIDARMNHPSNHQILGPDEI